MKTTSTLISALEIAHRVQSGQTSAAQVVREHLDRIATLDGELGAFQVVRAERALAEAAALDTRTDRASLPLAGVPVAIKDNFDVAGEPTRFGSAATSAEPVERDDELVRRLREAGCIVIGKTRMPELAIWGFTSSVYGPTRNPWNRELDPGGSTGGGAVAVATGMAALTLGTDGGGSLRIPAAYCGVVGFKPGPGVVPLPEGKGQHWFGLTSAGPMARSVADAAAMLAVLEAKPSHDLAAPEALRVAMSLRSPSPIGRPDEPYRAALVRAGRRLEELGHQVTTANPPHSPMLTSRWTRYWHAGVADAAQDLPATGLEPRTRVVVAKGRRVLRLGGPRPSVAAASRRRMSAWLEAYDVLITPTVAKAPPAAGSLDGRGYVATLLSQAAAVPYTQAWNLAGLPAVAIPTGLRSDGLPESVQLIGKPGAEALLLAVASQLERFQGPS